MVNHSDEADPGGHLLTEEDKAESRLALARSNFEPIRCFLDRMGALIAGIYENSAELGPIGEMQPTAQNAYEVRYSLCHADDARLGLTFILTGDHADLILLQGHERLGPRNLNANPGQFDQHAYRLDELEELKDAIRVKILAHLAAAL